MITYDCEFPPDHHIEIRIDHENRINSVVRIYYDGKLIRGIKPRGPTAASAWQGLIGKTPIMIYIGGNDHPAMLLTGKNWRDGSTGIV